MAVGNGNVSEIVWMPLQHSGLILVLQLHLSLAQEAGLAPRVAHC